MELVEGHASFGNSRRSAGGQVGTELYTEMGEGTKMNELYTEMDELYTKIGELYTEIYLNL